MFFREASYPRVCTAQKKIRSEFDSRSPWGSNLIPKFHRSDDMSAVSPWHRPRPRTWPHRSYFAKIIGKILQFFWRARSRLHQNEILQENMRLTAFFKLYKICTLLHRCNLKIFAKSRFQKTAIFVKIQQKFCKCRKICKNCQISKCQLDNLVDFEKFFKTRICLQRSAPIQPKTSEILPKFCQRLATN